MLDKLDAALRFQQEALNLRAQRQEILAANIANADTPGYQARDVDFASELKKVMDRGRAETSQRIADADLRTSHSGPGDVCPLCRPDVSGPRSAIHGR
jgi:Flagellar basal body protein